MSKLGHQARVTSGSYQEIVVALLGRRQGKVTPPLAHSLTHSRTHSLTFTHSLTISLTISLSTFTHPLATELATKSLNTHSILAHLTLNPPTRTIAHAR